MSVKWMTIAFALTLSMTLINGLIFVSQLSSPVNAATASARKILDDDDFIAGLTKIIRKTVRDYCTVGKKNGLDC
ncbi:MAG: hypothetical protein QOJ84_279 [Bradyrhizobium sp.]|nr:hypothetical protein [Bradyrhizobium sp.]